MKLMNAHSFSNAEENIIMKALLEMADNFLKECGVESPDDLTRSQRLYYNDIMRIYNNF